MVEAMSAATAPPPNFAERLAKVRVGLRPELEFSRHTFRGRPGYVLRDPITFQTHHLNETDYAIVAALSPDRSLHKVFERLVDGKLLNSGDEEGFYRFIVGLNQRGLLSLPVSDGQQLHARYEKRKALERQSEPMRYLFYRVPLLRPDAFLDRTVRWFRPLFTRTAFLLWLIAAVASFTVLAIRWREFCDPLGSMLALGNLPLLWFLLVTIKIAHEFGHAYACKHFGGRVPEMGAYFVLLTPCAYVDASAAWGFPRRLERIIVSLAGMYVESMLAMLALVIWCVTEPGLVNSAAHYAMVLSTVVTIGFNINPLMKYDGYFVLADLLEIPNLAQQSKAETNGLLKRFALGVPYESPHRRSMRWGLIAYGIASSAYRVLITLGICTMFALTIPIMGVGLAIFYAVTAVRGAIVQAREFAQTTLAQAPHRRRALAVVGGLGFVVPALVLLVPIPWSRQAVGVVAQEEDQTLRAETAGFVRQLDVRNGQTIEAGATIATLENAEVVAEWQIRVAECARLRYELQGALSKSHAEAEAIATRLAQAEQELANATRRKEALTIHAPLTGEVTEVGQLEDAGRFIHVGEPVAEIGRGRWVVRALLNADGYAAARPVAGQEVEARLSGPFSTPARGKILRVDAAGNRRVDDMALTHLGGGDIAVHAETHEAVEPFYEVTIAVDAPAEELRHGMTAQVRFAPRTSMLGVRIYQTALRFLNQLRAAT
jgi:putative peptide zinc metalloprotease protein